MAKSETYISILTNTLTKKSNILSELMLLTISQKEDCLLNGSVDFGSFNEIVEKKAKYIDQLNQLDIGFETVYSRVEEELKSTREQFKAEILVLQGLITQITEKSVNLQSLEQQNKLEYDKFFVNKKLEIKEYRKSNQSVTKYYKNMEKQMLHESYFVDKTK